jgi:hypothetical protein
MSIYQHIEATRTNAPYQALNANHIFFQDVDPLDITGKLYKKGNDLCYDGKIISFGTPLNVNNTSLQYLGNNGLTMISGYDLGMKLDGYTDDAENLDNGLKLLSSAGASVTVLIDSPFGFCLKNSVEIPSNINLIINCPIYYEGDARIRCLGNYIDYFDQQGVNKLTLRRYSTGTTPYIAQDGQRIIKVQNASQNLPTDPYTSAQKLALVQAGDVIVIRGMSDANGNAVDSETLIVQSVDYTNYEITVTTDLLDEYKYDYPENTAYTNKFGKTDKTYISKIVSTSLTTNAVKGNMTISVTNSSLFEVGDVIEINDNILVKTVYPNSTSSNPFRVEINQVTDVDRVNNILTLLKPLPHTWDHSTYPVRVYTINTTRNSSIENAQVKYRKYPANRNVNPFELNRCYNCKIRNCSILNEATIRDVVLNRTIGNTISIRENNGTVFTANLGEGVMSPSEFAIRVTTALTLASPSRLSYTCSYTTATGKYTLSCVNAFSIVDLDNDNDGVVLVNGKKQLAHWITPTAQRTGTSCYALLGLHPNVSYVNQTSFTGEDCRWGLFYVDEYRNKLYTKEPGQSYITTTLEVGWYTQNTLIARIQQLLVSTIYNITYNTSTDLTTITYLLGGNFELNFTSVDSIFTFLGFHDAKGNTAGQLTGATSYTGASKVALTSKGHAFKQDKCFKCSVSDCLIGTPQYFASGEGYGYTIYRSSCCAVVNSSSTGCRHDVLLFSGANNNLIANNRFTSCRISSLDLHGALEVDNHFIGNVIIGGPLYTLDSTTKCAIKCGNTTHVAGSHRNNFIGNFITGYGSNADTSKTNKGIEWVMNAQDNVVKNCVFQDCEYPIYYTNYTNSDGANYFVSSNVVDNCVFKNSRVPIYLRKNTGGGMLKTAEQFTITNSVFDGIGSNSYIETVNAVNIQNCTFKNWTGGQDTGNDLYVLGFINTSNVVVRNNIIQNVRRGISATGCSNAIVQRNTFDYLTGAKADVFNDNGGNSNYKFQHNTYTNFNPRFTCNVATPSPVIKHERHQQWYDSASSSPISVTGIVPYDNTTPTSTEGTDLGFSISYSTQNPAGCFYVRCVVPQIEVPDETDDVMILSVFNGNANIGTSAVAFNSKNTTNNRNSYSIQCIARTRYWDRASYSITARLGTAQGTTLNVNNLFSSTCKPYIIIEEIDEKMF